MYEQFANPQKVGIVLNLTRPYRHYEVTKATLRQGSTSTPKSLRAHPGRGR